MSLKILDLSVGNEGIFSSVIDFFKGDSVHISQKDAEQKISDLFGGYKKDPKKIEAEVRAILDSTVFNQEWVSKAIPLKTSTHPYGQSWIDTKPVTNPIKLAAVINGPMFDGAKDALDKLKDNTALRLKLVAQMNKMHDEDDADELYKKHEKELAVDVVEIYLKKGGKAYSSITSDKAVKWPLEYHEGVQKGMVDFCEYLNSDKKNDLDLITEGTAAAYGKVILELITTAAKADKLYRDNNIPYWEDNDTLEYDDLTYGDEIFGDVYSDQRPYQASPMFVVSDEAIMLARKLLYMILVK